MTGPPRRLLFLSPVMPAWSGNGLAMRAGAVLDALAADHAIDLLVIPIAGPARDPEPAVRERCAAIAVQHDVARHVDPAFTAIASITAPARRRAARLAYPRPALCRFATPAAVRAASDLVGGRAYDDVHVFRLYLAPFAEPHLAAPAVGPRPACALDLDDDEVAGRRRLSTLLRTAGDHAGALREAAEAARYAELERAVLPRFDRVFAASARDAAAIARRLPGRPVDVLPNVVRPVPAGPPPPADAPFTFLFVGNLGYFPNEDGLRFFCDEALPILRRIAPRPFRVEIVGAGPSPRVAALGAHPEVTVVGPVADVTPAYRRAHAAIVPLRTGGGTRIKILEAFAHERPVVSTAVGAEGLEVEAGRHLAIADPPADLAEACAHLMASPATGASYVREALALVRERYAPARLRSVLRRAAV